jgi:sec-independent protein translocase protein TatB
MFNIGTGEIIVIALIALIVLGPDKLPQAARQVGHYTAEARKIANGFRQEMKSAMDEVADTAKSTVEPDTTVAGANGGARPDDRRPDRQLSAPPADAQPIDVEPAEARPLSPPPGEVRPSAVRPDDPSSN